MMKSNNNLRLIMLNAFLVLVTGCAAKMNATVVSLETTQLERTVKSTRIPVETAILSKIPTMRPGMQDTVGVVDFTVGETYSAASGRQCKPVVITAGYTVNGISNKLACGDHNSWFFSKDVVMTDPYRN